MKPAHKRFIDQVVEMAARGIRNGEIAKRLGMDAEQIANYKAYYAGRVHARRCELQGLRADGTPVPAMATTRKTAKEEMG